MVSRLVNFCLSFWEAAAEFRVGLLADNAQLLAFSTDSNPMKRVEYAVVRAN